MKKTKLTVKFTTQFRKDYKLAMKRGLRIALLEEVVERLPLVLFFPGEYRQLPGSGASLALFGRLTGDGYYRAFNILEAQI